MRGSLVYLALFFILRFVARRQSGSVGPADLLVIVLIADASQNALGKNYVSVTEWIVLVPMIFAGDYLIDWAKRRFPAMRGVLERSPLLIIVAGRVLEEHLRQEKLTREELETQLREHGLAEPAAVKEARLEADGLLTVLRRDGR